MAWQDWQSSKSWLRGFTRQQDTAAGLSGPLASYRTDGTFLPVSFSLVHRLCAHTDLQDCNWLMTGNKAWLLRFLQGLPSPDSCYVKFIIKELFHLCQPELLDIESPSRFFDAAKLCCNGGLLESPVRLATFS